MEGAVTWPQITFLTIIILATTGAGYMVAWRINILRSKDRQAIVEQLNARFDVMNARVTAVEHFNIGTTIVLENMKEFREEVKQEFDRLVEQRQADMEGLHRRLDALHNSARLERIIREDESRKREAAEERRKLMEDDSGGS